MRVRIRKAKAITNDGKVMPFHKRIVSVDDRDVAYLSINPGGLLHIFYPLPGCTVRQVVCYVAMIDGKQPIVKQGTKPDETIEGDGAPDNRERNTNTRRGVLP